MGVVYRARDERLGRDVAIKLVYASGAGSLGRAEREAQALAKLSHPNVVTVYEVGEHGGALFVAMEYVAGGTARTWLLERTRSWRDIVALYRDRRRRARRGARRRHRASRLQARQRARRQRRPCARRGLRARGRAGCDVDPNAATAAPSSRRRPRPARSWARRRTWRPNSCAARTPTRAPISSRFASRCGRRSTACGRSKVNPGKPASVAARAAARERCARPAAHRGRVAAWALARSDGALADVTRRRRARSRSPARAARDRGHGRAARDQRSPCRSRYIAAIRAPTPPASAPIGIQRVRSRCKRASSRPVAATRGRRSPHASSIATRASGAMPSARPAMRRVTGRSRPTSSTRAAPACIARARGSAPSPIRSSRPIGPASRPPPTSCACCRSWPIAATAGSRRRCRRSAPALPLRGARHRVARRRGRDLRVRRAAAQRVSTRSTRRRVGSSTPAFAHSRRRCAVGSSWTPESDASARGLRHRDPGLNRSSATSTAPQR